VRGLVLNYAGFAFYCILSLISFALLSLSPSLTVSAFAFVLCARLIVKVPGGCFVYLPTGWVNQNYFKSQRASK